MENNRQLRVRVRVRFIFFYSELTPNDPWYNMLQTLLGQKNMTRKIWTTSMCSIKTSCVSSFKIGFTYVSICFRVVPISGLYRVLNLFNFELNSFLRIHLIIMVPIIRRFEICIARWIKVVAFFIWRCNRSLSGYLFIAIA